MIYLPTGLHVHPKGESRREQGVLLAAATHHVEILVFHLLRQFTWNKSIQKNVCDSAAVKAEGEGSEQQLLHYSHHYV